MRTTVDIPDPLYRRLKATAALRGCTVKEVLVTMVTREMEGSPRKKRRVKLPIIDSDRPGSLHLTNAQVNEILFP